MKIVLATHHFPPDRVGGAAWRAYRTARWLIRQGHQVQVICVESISHQGDTLHSVDERYDGVPVRRLYFNLKQAPHPFLWSYRNPWIGEHLRGFLREFAPDVLHLISGYLMSGAAISTAGELGIPVVVTLTDFWFLCPHINLVQSDGTLCQMPIDHLKCTLCLCKEKRRLRIPDHLSKGILGGVLRRLWQHPLGLRLSGVSHLKQEVQLRHDYLLSLLNAVEVVISPSRFLKQLFEAQGVRPRRFLYIRQGLDLEGWAPAEQQPANSHLRIGYIGQIARHKGVDVLMRAFCQLHPGKRKPQLFIYGHAEQFPGFTRQLQNDIRGRDDVVFAGRFDNSRIGRIHAGLDVLVVPSVWYENSPTVILEAFAAGTPVVTSDLGGMAELVQHGVNGLRFTPADADDLARQLQLIVDDPAVLEQLKQGILPVKTAQEEGCELANIYHSLQKGDQL